MCQSVCVPQCQTGQQVNLLLIRYLVFWTSLLLLTSLFGPVYLCGTEPFASKLSLIINTKCFGDLRLWNPGPNKVNLKMI